MTDFWNWAIAAYARPGVAEACLELQDAHGQNVPLLLWATWRGSRGEGVDAETAAEVARAWETEVIAPIRGVRRRLKTELNASDETVRLPLREAVKALELKAERALMTQLEAIGGKAPGDPAANLAAVATAWRANIPHAALARLAAALATV